MKRKAEVLILILLVLFVYFSPGWLFDHQAVFALLSPGPHTKLWHLLVFIIFLASRLVVYLLLPTYVIIRVTSVLLSKKRQKPETL